MVSVDVKGASDALEIILGLIIPWRREYAERRAKLENAQRHSEIQRVNAETLMAQAKAEREKSAKEMDNRQAELAIAQARKLEAEAELIFAQAKKIRVEVAKELAILQEARVNLAIKIMDKYSPNIDEIEKTRFINQRLTLVLNQLIDSEIQPTSPDVLTK